MFHFETTRRTEPLKTGVSFHLTFLVSTVSLTALSDFVGQPPSQDNKMATYTKEILKEGTGPGIRVGQQVTVEVCIIVLS